jgi:enamine deaminase RidA (YjgF/YER057c/UK114 family)
MGILSRLGLDRAFAWLRGSQPATAIIKRHDIGPTMSKAVEFHHWVFLAGMTADDTSVGIKEQTEQVLAKIDRTLAVANSDKSKLLSAMIFLSDISLRPQLNEVWNAWIDAANPPTRACVGVQLAGSTMVEVVVTAKD